MTVIKMERSKQPEGTLTTKQFTAICLKNPAATLNEPYFYNAACVVLQKLREERKLKVIKKSLGIYYYSETELQSLVNSFKDFSEFERALVAAFKANVAARAGSKK